MSKWRKALKNKRRFDARYFLNERVEGQEVVENSVQQEKVKKDFRDFSFDSWLTEDQDLDEMHCNSKRDDKVNEEDSNQAILNLIKQRIKEVGFGKETEEDFDAAKIELMDDYPDKKNEIENITWDQFTLLNEENLEEKGKCDHIDCESVDEGHDGATKGHSEMSPATKGREMRPFDYDKGEIGDEVFEEESAIGKEEESPRYDEPMEELVVPGVMPKGGGDADGMSPAQIRMAKAKEKAKKAREDAKKKGLGPVVDEG